MRFFVSFIVGVGLVIGAGCGVTTICDLECPSWQECVDGRCVTRAGHCEDDEACPISHPYCIENVCVVEASSEEPEEGENGGGENGGGENGQDPECGPCEEWEECDERDMCVPKPGRCNDHADCELLCDLETNECLADHCEPACGDWQECRGTDCVPQPGRCADSDDCPPDAPHCLVEENICAASLPHLFDEWPGVIITSQSLAPAFEELAAIHTVTGAPTRIVTVEEICGSTCSTTDTREDAPARIKEWLGEQDGLRYVLLGGGIDHVPSREVSASYSNAMLGVSFDETFVTDFYFADLSEWDKNGNGIYAEPEDRPASGETGVLDYVANLAVTRLPVNDAHEIDRYTQKVIHHLMHKELSRTREALLLSNVATTISLGFTSMDIDGGRYFHLPGRTVDILPDETEYVRLYALGGTLDYSAETLTVARQREEMEKGPNLILHSGHGNVGYLTVEENGANAFTRNDAQNLINSEYPIMLSCACSAGNFAHPWQTSAGESLINAQQGGAVGYMGNTATGLGLAGGNQLIDEFLRHAFAHSNPRVGDCLIAAHDEFTYPDHMNLGIAYLDNVEVVNRDSWEWTKKSAVYFGDPMIPVVTDPSTGDAPRVLVSSAQQGGTTEMEFSVVPAVAGVLTVEVGGKHYRWGIEAGEQPSARVAGHQSSARVGFVAQGKMPSYEQHVF